MWSDTSSRISFSNYLVSLCSTLCYSFFFLRRFRKCNRSFRLSFCIFFSLKGNRRLFLYFRSFKILFIIFFFEFLISVTVFHLLFLNLYSLFRYILFIFLFNLWWFRCDRLLQLILIIFLIIFDFGLGSCLFFLFIDFYQIDIWATFITFLCVSYCRLCNCW